MIIIYSIILFFFINSISLVKCGILSVRLIPVLFIIYIAANLFPSLGSRKLRSRRLRICEGGCTLLCIFLFTSVITIFYSLFAWTRILPMANSVPGIWIGNTICAILMEAVLFWNGILRIYFTSIQLGLKFRILGIICGFIPIINLVVLVYMIYIVHEEVIYENQKMLLNEGRKEQAVCKTKYPLLLVHGVFFRDSRFFNYWGRIPKELLENGAVIFYGEHQSAASVEESGKELADRIRYLTEQTGCEKVNIIAHSKGGLDCRYAVSELGIADKVASLTTINTPHRGCEFADYLLSKIPAKQKETIAQTYNKSLKKLGEPNPDFLAAVQDLTYGACRERNERIEDAESVYYQSVGSCLNVAKGGRFPLNFTYCLVEYFDGKNDGLVGEKSFPWGAEYKYLTVRGKRGISHGDMIDLNRENFPDFDVREFYVQLVHDLKKRGL